MWECARLRKAIKHTPQNKDDCARAQTLLVVRLRGVSGKTDSRLSRVDKSPEDWAKSQRFVTQGYSHAYNTHFPVKSSTKDLSPPTFERTIRMMRGRTLS